jgi:hypothetical protein
MSNPKIWWGAAWAILIWILSGFVQLEVNPLMILFVVVIALGPSIFLGIKWKGGGITVKWYDYIGILATLAVVYAIVRHVPPQEVFAFIECIATRGKAGCGK